MLGRVAKTAVLLLSGRAHFYEGHAMDSVTFPIRVLAEFGIRDLLLTNAAGGINRRLRPGDFMLLTDHINFMPANPLRRELAEAGRSGVDRTSACERKGEEDRNIRVTFPRFVDLTSAYDPGLNR